MNMNQLNKSLLKKFVKLINLDSKRSFLTENYFNYANWDKYLISDVVKKVGSINDFSLEIGNKLNQKSLVTPLDMDLLATKLIHVNNFQELDFIENLFSNFRKTQSSLYVRDSMHYSFVRNYIDLNQADRLLQILKLKYKYGIYLDCYTANMLIDLYLKQQDFKRAALTAHEILLQEETENELTQSACLLSCLKYLEKFGSLDQPPTEESQTEQEKKTKVLVYFLRSNYNDQHFDLKSIPLLNAKTIYFTSSNLKNIDQNLKTNLTIFGLLLFGKQEKAISLFEQEVFGKQGCKIFKFVLEEFKKLEEEIKKDEEKASKNENYLKKWSELLAKLNADQIVEFNLAQCVNQVENLIEKLKSNQIEIDLKAQNGLLAKWSKEQEEELNQQIKNFTIELKKENILKRLDDLERQEEILTFFDKRQEIIDSYYGHGFPNEYPSQIPLEPEESVFKSKYERHFKPWQKYMNRPAHTLKISKSKEYKLESLKKIYLSNKSTETASTTTSKAEN